MQAKLNENEFQLILYKNNVLYERVTFFKFNMAFLKSIKIYLRL